MVLLASMLLVVNVGWMLFLVVADLTGTEGALRERLRAGRGVGGGDHHAAGPRQHDLPVGDDPQHRRVLRLDRPHQAKAGEEAVDYVRSSPGMNDMIMQCIMHHARMHLLIVVGMLLHRAGIAPVEPPLSCLQSAT